MHLRLKKAFAALVVVLVTAGVVVATQQPAAANAPCPAGYACFYEHIGYSGNEVGYYSGFRGQCVTMYGIWHDSISSFQNNIGGDIRMYRNTNCNDDQGSWWYFNGGSVGDMRAWGWNDTIDSIRFY